jgi:hypothetical protein
MKGAVTSTAVLLLLGWVLGSGVAHAARNATVDGKNIQLYASPDKSSQVLGTLDDGEALQVSNYPTQGFYKVRTASGDIGWVLAAAINTDDESLPAPESSALDIPVPKPAPSPKPTPAPALDERTVDAQDLREGPVPVRNPYEIKAYVGIQKVSLSDVNNLLGTTVVNTMPYFGAQFGLPLSGSLNLLFRVDHLTASATAVGDSFSLSSTPLMLGFEYAFYRRKTFFMQASVLTGVALANTLDATASSQPTPNLTELSATSFTEMLKIDAGYDLSRVFSIYAEAGYRFLKSESVGPSIVGNGSSVFQNSSGSYVPVPVDFSGPFIGIGLDVHL